MSVISFALSHTVGVVLPRYRTLGQWSEVYDQIIEGLPVTDKTKANRRCSTAHVVRGLGRGRIISRIRPHDVSAFIGRIHKDHPPLSKRLLIETKSMFNGALDYGWLDRNPAAQIRAQHVTVRRNRLTLEQWLAIYSYAVEHMPPWVAHMMVLALVTGQRRSDLVKMRPEDVWDGHLHIEQAKTGARLAIPLDLRMDAIGVSVGEAIEACIGYAKGDEYLLRKSTGKRPGAASLSARFEEAREASIPPPKTGTPVSLHEIRSLSERLYRVQGINTMVLLGHTTQQMTDMYNDDRGLSAGSWKTLELQSA
ncbi:tyrosine-type recombinase/integrase [Rhodoferax sp. BLA1]|uniref:tyrosine-type recombinase/integrase n=1 Tax=Rhodoferax sp. BLA1 TaxID=2576062 RepID=UPI0015D45A33|nr:tyrosine-type recombinase/integrase [Rhodoferax sp. BLA1]